MAAGAPAPLRPAGTARLRVWGFEVYDAALSVAPGFRRGDYARHAFALELRYLRSFSGADIARRSLVEMERAGGFTARQGQRWQRELAQLLPDVVAGDRLTGLHTPGAAASFLFNDKPLGTIADPAFAAPFFGIWLGPATSEPALRDALLAGTEP
jgi:hypothetical protein